MSTAFNFSLSLKEFLRRPDREDGQREELIAGQLILSPSAKAWHADIVRRLHRKLAQLEENGYALVNDSSCILGEHSMPASDLAVVKEERWQEAVDNEGWLQGSPELVIEVASPGNRNLHRKS
ncbi:MAG: Uma2 family endonuclease [Acidobacteriaceae bacterium]|nr:Uma2 family endonuclease [Acidobacteriaceae bacterium]